MTYDIEHIFKYLLLHWVALPLPHGPNGDISYSKQKELAYYYGEKCF